MRSRDARATTAGLLLVAATAASLIATTLRGSLLDGSGFLATVALHQNRLLAAALFQLLAAFTSAAIAVTLYPVLRLSAAGTALGAVAFRLIEGVFYALAAVGTLILVSLSGPQIVLNLPIGVQEMVLAVWLIVKGFSTKARPAPPLSRQQSQAFADRGSAGL